jgi:hypothetical protein
VKKKKTKSKSSEAEEADEAVCADPGNSKTRAGDRTRLFSLADILEQVYEPREEGQRFARVLRRYLANGYTPVRGHPPEDARNFWLTVHYLLLRDHGGLKGSAAAQDITKECRIVGLKLRARTISDLVGRYPQANATAAKLRDQYEHWGDIFPDRAKQRAASLDAACREAMSHWRRAHEGYVPSYEE